MQDLNNGEQWSVFVYLCHTTCLTLLRLLLHFFKRILPCSAPSRAAGVNLPGDVTYFTDPKAKNTFSYKLTDADADRSKGGKAPVKKSKIPELQAGIDNAGGELQQRAGAGGAMSFIGAMPVKKSKAPVLQAAIDDAGGELQRAGAGGSMSVIGTMPVKKSKAPVLQAAIDDSGGELQRAGAGGSMPVIGAMQVDDGTSNGTTVRACVKAGAPLGAAMQVSGRWQRQRNHGEGVRGSCQHAWALHITCKVVPAACRSDKCNQCQLAVMMMAFCVS
jgi:hypothetical protein